MSALPSRSRKILFAVVTEFIATGDPVGSRTLARKYGLDLSAASIRNVLADLEEGGYLKQPHTSAGRIPTDRAFRLFIDTLMEVRALTPEEQAKRGAEEGAPHPLPGPLHPHPTGPAPRRAGLLGRLGREPLHPRGGADQRGRA